MQERYDLEKIKALLMEAFTDEELRRFCYDTSEFESVYNLLDRDTTKSQVTNRLIQHAARKSLLDIVLSFAKVHHPTAYEKYHPYYDASTSPIRQKSTSVVNRFRWSMSSIVAIIAGIVIAIIWMFQEPGFEPLLAVISGLGTAVVLNRANLSRIIDLVVAVLIVFVSGFGIIYLLSPENAPPVINSLTPSVQIVSPGQTVTITVIATDKDNDPLSYIWSAGRGTVPDGSRGPQIEYVAPMNPGIGIDTIKVTVTDGKKNGTVTAQTTISIENSN